MFHCPLLRTFAQSYPVAYAKIVPWELKQQEVIERPISSEVFSFVLASLSQKENLPSEPEIIKE